MAQGLLEEWKRSKSEKIYTAVAGRRANSQNYAFFNTGLQSTMAEFLAISIGLAILFFVMNGRKGNRTTSPTRPTPSLASYTAHAQHHETSNQNRKGKPGIWIPANEEIRIKSFRIATGLLYFGSHLEDERGWSNDCALIDPLLQVSKKGRDPTGSQMGYWPSYSEINPSCRATYLEWLESGKRDPEIGVGYVFLYFYGLERRVLKDGVDRGIHASELATIKAEVKRLHAIYGQNGSFSGYARGFLSILNIIANDGQDNAESWQRGSELALDIRMQVGKYALKGKPLPAELAFAWATSEPEFRLGTPAKRCSDQFEKLFTLRYLQSKGGGILLKSCKRTVTATYRPASFVLRPRNPNSDRNP